MDLQCVEGNRKSDNGNIDASMCMCVYACLHTQDICNRLFFCVILTNQIQGSNILSVMMFRKPQKIVLIYQYQYSDLRFSKKYTYLQRTHTYIYMCVRGKEWAASG